LDLASQAQQNNLAFREFSFRVFFMATPLLRLNWL